MARHVGNKVTLLSIRQGAGFDGAAHHETYVGNSQYTMPERYILVCVAGYIAEWLMLGVNDPDMCVSDMREAWAAAIGQNVLHDPAGNAAAKSLYECGATVDDPRWPNRSDAERLVAAMERECHRILASLKAKFERLVAHLEQYKVCDGRDVDAVCDGTWQAPKAK